MRYECENGHLFEHTAKVTLPTIVGALDGTMEYHACPHCGTKTYSEEHIGRKTITSVRSVPLEDVDELLAEGYEVEAMYAKTATLVKKEAEKQ